MLITVLIGVILLWGTTKAKLIMSDPLHATVTEAASVHHVRDASEDMSARYKRDAGGLPSTLEFHVSTADGHVTELLMQKHPRTDQPIPLHVMDRGALSPIDVTHESEWALYTDREQQASFLVHREQLGDQSGYILNGVLRHKNMVMQIRPDYPSTDSDSPSSARVKRETRGGHSDSSGGTGESGSADLPDVVQYVVADIGKEPLHYDKDAPSVGDSVTYKFDASRFSMGDATWLPRRYLDRRTKRASCVGVDNVVEVFQAIDNPDYADFLGRAGADPTAAMSAILQFYSFMELIVNSIFETFEDQSSGNCLTIRTIGIVVDVDGKSSPWFTDNISDGIIDPGKALRAWGTAGPTMMAADHYIAMTRGNFPLAGTAYIGAMCSTTLSAGISFNLRSALTAVVIAHEIGHNLNATHDSLAGCLDADSFVMATALVRPSSIADYDHTWTFSTCSVSFFDTFLGSGSSNCLRTTQSTNSVLATSQLPGQVIDADGQCKMFSGYSSSTLCRDMYTSPVDIEVDICSRVFCTNDFFSSCIATPPLEYTSCGNKKWCIRGICTSDDAAPARFDKCPQGDDPGIDCAPLLTTCGSNETVRLTCCESCARETGLTLPPTRRIWQRPQVYRGGRRHFGRPKPAPVRGEHGSQRRRPGTKA